MLHKAMKLEDPREQSNETSGFIEGGAFLD
jgi:hypothetical protein